MKIVGAGKEVRHRNTAGRKHRAIGATAHRDQFLFDPENGYKTAKLYLFKPLKGTIGVIVGCRTRSMVALSLGCH